MWRAVLAVGLLMLVGSVALGGVKGLAGFVLGAGGGAFNLWAWWRILSFTSSLAPGNNERAGTVFILLSFFAKLPLFLLVVWLVFRIGGAAPGCFLAALALVYSALVGWALARG